MKTIPNPFEISRMTTLNKMKCTRKVIKKINSLKMEKQTNKIKNTMRKSKMKEKNKYLQLEWISPIETIKTKILSINRVRIIFQLISLEKTMIKTLESIIFLNSDCKKATKKR